MSNCWVDLFEESSFGGKLRRLVGPADYAQLRGVASRVQVHSAIAGPGAYLYFYESANPERGVWVLPGASIARLTDARIAESMDSIRVCDHAPQAHDSGYAAFTESKRGQSA